MAFLVTQDQAAQIQAVAAEWQAGAAVAIAILTLVLIGATIVYVMKTSDLVRVSQNQLNEFKEARAASYRPYVRVLEADRPDQGSVTIQIKNLGPGPAIALMGAIDFPGFVRRRDMSPIDVLSGEVVSLALPLPTGPTGRRSREPKYIVLLEYHDLGGDWWHTTVPLGRVFPDGSPPGPPPVVWPPGPVEVQDQKKSIQPIDQPVIRHGPTDGLSSETAQEPSNTKRPWWRLW